ncbi:MAG: ferredoxin [Acidimicrobiia bacterium]
MGERAWSVSIDRELCMGAGLCVMYAPDTFDQDDAVKAVFKPDTIDSIDAVRVAVEACPTGAITLNVPAND